MGSLSRSIFLRRDVDNACKRLLVGFWHGDPIGPAVRAKPVIPRTQAARDADAAIACYVDEGADEGALGFVDARERAFHHIGRHPESDSPRHAHESNLPGLRCWPLTGYPYLVFDVERSDHVDVWRVLHGERDIGAWMREPGAD